MLTLGTCVFLLANEVSSAFLEDQDTLSAPRSLGFGMADDITWVSIFGSDVGH